MEVYFVDPKLADHYEGKNVKDKHFRYPPELIKQYIKTVRKLESVDRIEELSQYHSLAYEKLKGDLKGYSSVRINKKYRLIFQEVLSIEEPFEVKLLAIVEVSNHYS